MPLWRKAIADYVAAGGGALTLTPLTGDVLLDPFLVDRLEDLRSHPEIGKVWFYTNAIAWKRISDEARWRVLGLTDEICVSVSGPDRRGYAQLMGVDKFDVVIAALQDMISKQRDIPDRPKISIVARVPEELGSADFSRFRQLGADSFSIDSYFHNWAGAISNVPMVRACDARATPSPCTVLYMAPWILVDGRVTACACANPEGRALELGSICRSSLTDIWRSDAWRELMQLFEAGRRPEICTNCTYYEDGRRVLSDERLTPFVLGDSPWDYV